MTLLSFQGNNIQTEQADIRLTHCPIFKDEAFAKVSLEFQELSLRLSNWFWLESWLVCPQSLP